MNAAGPAVRFEFTKWPGGRHWHYEMIRLGSDRHGLWLGAPRGTVVQRGSEPSRPHPHGFVKLIPRGDLWWAAIFNDGTDPRYEVYVDIATPPEIGDGVVRAVDLDLDVVRRRDGSVAVLDEDEFEQHRIEFSYPAGVVAAARDAAAGIARALKEHSPPFDGTAAAWLDRLGPGPAASR